MATETERQGFTALSTARPAFSAGPGGFTASLAFWIPWSTFSPAFSAGPWESQPTKLAKAPSIRAVRAENRVVLGMFIGRRLLKQTIGGPGRARHAGRDFRSVMLQRRCRQTRQRPP